jgi:hypothetical protein
MPDGPFDLIVASEILYYYTGEEMVADATGLRTRAGQGRSPARCPLAQSDKNLPAAG